VPHFLEKEVQDRKKKEKRKKKKKMIDAGQKKNPLDRKGGWEKGERKAKAADPRAFLPFNQ